MRKVRKAASRRDCIKGGGRKVWASRHTKGVAVSANGGTGGSAAPNSTGTKAPVPCMNAVRCGCVCNTSQQVAETVVTGCSWSTGAQSSACPKLRMLGPPITHVMRANAGAAVPRMSSSMASTDKPWVRNERMRCIACKGRGSTTRNGPEWGLVLESHGGSWQLRGSRGQPFGSSGTMHPAECRSAYAQGQLSVVSVRAQGSTLRRAAPTFAYHADQ